MEGWRYWLLLGVSVLVGFQMLLVRSSISDVAVGSEDVVTSAVRSVEEIITSQVESWSEDAPMGIVLDSLTVGADELVSALRNVWIDPRAGTDRNEELAGGPAPTVFLYNCRVKGYLDLFQLTQESAADGLSTGGENTQQGPIIPFSFQFRDCELDHLSFRDAGSTEQLSTQIYPATGIPTQDDVLGNSDSVPSNRASLSGDLVFHNCRIEELWLHGVDVHGAIQISFCEIGSLSWANSVFWDRVFVGDTTVLHAADFTRARFRDELKIYDGTFRGFVEFEECSFEGPTSLEGTFEEVADFEGARFGSDLSISGARFLSGAYLALTSFDNAAESARGTALLRSSLGWKSVGDQKRASYYFREYMIEERSSKALPTRVLEMTLVDWTSGYGTMWHRILISWAVVILVGTIALWIGRGIERGDDRIPIRSFWLSLYFSIVTFTTLGYGDYRPRGIYRIVADITALLGAFMMALFVVVFVRQYAP